ncbi:dystonin isoform X8 [Brienomyrus brachyistius]|uniref:dystonin isoform X8 n=1 Tax=Brienomyrus brachyistius TaxID=42636 RepID=UPI0020B2B18A|nr:dystonin isoform X8 [Brienomyrus brachyistius]
MMIAAAFLVLLRPYSIQCVLLLLLLLLGTIATILFFCCWHRKLRSGKHPIKAVFSGRSRSREVGLRTYHFRSEGYRHSPRHARRSTRLRASEESKPLVEIPESDADTSAVRKRKVKKRVQPEFYQSVQLTPTRKPSSGSGNASLRCSMSSSADFSDEDDYSFKSGSASPAPGDTLPWNLPRHERSKRKIQGGSVLDPAERAVLRIADERDRVQKKTFTKWINQHLLKVRKHVNDLYEDLRDGHNLISLLEVLSGESLPRERDFLKTLRLVSAPEACAPQQHGDAQDDDKGPREKGRMRFHRLQNVQIALDYLKRRQVKLVNIRNDDITDGNPKLTLGLIWTIILHFQISDIHVTGESEDMTAKERLLLWSQHMTEGYVGVRCDNFTTSWRDGRLFNAIIHKHRPDLVDMSKVSVQSSRSNLEQAFMVAEQLGVARLLDPEDVDVQSPDEKSVITYVSTLYDVFPKVSEGMEGISANDVDIKWVEYQNMVNYLSQWIKHHIAIMSNRAFPNNPAELKALYSQYLQFKETEIPVKENEKTRIKHLYRMLEVWMEFGRIQLPQGYHPNDVEKEWGKLIIAMLEREKSLRPEVDRLDMLQQIANKVHQDCMSGEDKLALARSALQSDAKRLESGIQFQHEADVAGYLLECENLLRQQVVDIQALLDGKFYLADQLLQRVSKLRDDLLALRTECGSIYSKGRTLSTEQTKMMISGITQSLNSGFSQGISMGLTPGSLVAPGSTFTSSLGSSLMPGLPSGMLPGSIQSYVGSTGGIGVDHGALHHLKQLQIRKPLGKSSLVDPNLSEEEVNMKFVQDLLNWVEEMQVQLDQAEWGSDLASVEMHLENHKSVHGAIEEFQMSLKEAKISEIQMSQPLKLSYSEKLSKLESQYGRLLNSSRNRQKYLESLHEFVSSATRELIWLNEKEEEEVAYDWSDRNSSISKKRDYHADLMRELEERETAIKSVQDKAECLLLESHPARLTIEAYRAAMQTQWNWVLQLCGCVEQHLKENAIYFEFFTDAKESLDYLKNLQDAIQRKYGCDRTSSLHKLEDLVQESMDEKEQLLQYRSTIASLVGRAKAIVQLKPRNPESPIRTSIPVRAICDYRQIEITIYKDDECVLANNSHRAKWKVISPAGNEAMVPSVCFTVPPPNKEAMETAARTEQLYQNVLALWHRSHVNMKSVVSWHFLMKDIQAIRKSNVASIKTMLPGEHQQVLSTLQSHFEGFLEDSEESEVFSLADRTHLEREVLACREFYEDLLKSAEREEQEESVYNLFISEVRNFRMRLEGHEEHLIRQIRTPVDRDDLQKSVMRIAEQERMKKELDQLKEDLEIMKVKCETFISQASASPSVPNLSSELNVLIQSMNQVYSMSSIHLEKLKTVSLVVKHSQEAEALLKLYEAKLCEEDTVNADIKAIEMVMSTLKQWRTEIDEKREVFHELEDELQKARNISDRMFKTHNERDFDLDWHKDKADQLSERWMSLHSQIENRLRDLEGIGKSLKYYRETYHTLDEWINEMETTQLKAQQQQALAELLHQQKVLISEIEQKHSKIDECQKYSEQYSAAVKDYDLQLMTYRAMVDSQHKSPMKRRRMQSSSDAIIQEFMELRTRYTALVTLMTQYVKFASENLKRTEEEEKSVDDEKKEHGEKVNKLLDWMSSMKRGLSREDKAVIDDGSSSREAPSQPQVSTEELGAMKEQVAEALRTTQIMLSRFSGRMSEEEEQEMKEQQKALQQAYSSLFQQCAEQIPAADLDFQNIEGIFDVASGAVYSVCRSVQSGLIDQSTGLSLLEAQMITSGLIIPEFRRFVDLEEAYKHNLVDEATYQQLQHLNEANRCTLSARYTSEPLPVIAAVKDGTISEEMAIKIIEIQLATGGLRLTYTRDVLNLESAFQYGLMPASLFVKVLERQNNWKDLIDPNSAEKVSLIQLVQRSFLHEDTGLRLLLVKKGRDGTISLKSGREISILRAVHEGLIDRETILRLLGAQLFAGGIVDPKTGFRLTVEEAVAEGLIDQDTACGVLSLQVQNGGIVNPHNGERLTIDEAVQCNLMSSSSALLVLERQKSFMGLLWPHSGEILTVSTSLHHEMITNQVACKLLSNRQKIAAFYVPEVPEVVSFESAAEYGLINKCTYNLLKTVQVPDSFPNIDEPNDTFSTWLSWRELQLEGSHQGAEDLPMEAKNVLVPSPSEARKLFVSYLMMNSYMDPKSGQRLLIFDGQLNKMAQLFTENIMEPSLEMQHNATNNVDDSASKGTSTKDDTTETLTGAVLHPDYSVEDKGCLCLNEDRIEEEQRSPDVDELILCHKANGQSQGSYEKLTKSRSYEADVMESKSELQGLSENALETQKQSISHSYQKGGELKCNAFDDLYVSESQTKQNENVSQARQTEMGETKEEKSPTSSSEVCYDAGSRSTEGVLVKTDSHPVRAPNVQLNVDENSESLTKHPEQWAYGDGVWRAKEEQKYAVHLLKAQVEEGGILDVTSGKRYDLNAALNKGLLDEGTALELLALELHNDHVPCNQMHTLLTLKKAVEKGSITSKVALQIMEHQKLLGNFCDSESKKCITVSEALEQGLISDDLIERIFRSDLSIGAIMNSIISDIECVQERQCIDILKDPKTESLPEECTGPAKYIWKYEDKTMQTCDLTDDLLFDRTEGVYGTDDQYISLNIKHMIAGSCSLDAVSQEIKNKPGDPSISGEVTEDLAIDAMTDQYVHIKGSELQASVERNLSDQSVLKDVLVESSDFSIVIDKVKDEDETVATLCCTDFAEASTKAFGVQPEEQHDGFGTYEGADSCVANSFIVCKENSNTFFGLRNGHQNNDVSEMSDEKDLIDCPTDMVSGEEMPSNLKTETSTLNVSDPAVPPQVVRGETGTAALLHKPGNTHHLGTSEAQGDFCLTDCAEHKQYEGEGSEKRWEDIPANVELEDSVMECSGLITKIPWESEVSDSASVIEMLCSTQTSEIPLSLHITEMLSSAQITQTHGFIQASENLDLTSNEMSCSTQVSEMPVSLHITEMLDSSQITQPQHLLHASENLSSAPLDEMCSSAQTSEMHNTAQITEMHGSSHASENLNSAPLDEMCSSAQTSEMHNTVQITEMHGSSHVSENLNSAPLDEMCSSAQTSEMHNTAQITEMHGSSHASENLNSMPLDEMCSSAQTSEMHNTTQITEMHGSSHVSENLNSMPLDEMCSSAQTSEMHNTAQITEMHGSSHASENLNSMPLAEMHSSAQTSEMHNTAQITEMHGSSHASENLNSMPLAEMHSSAQTSEMHNTAQITEMHGSSHASENLNSMPLDEMCSSAQTSEMHNTAQITEMHGSSHVSENLNSMPLAEMHSSAQASMKPNVTQITEMHGSSHASENLNSAPLDEMCSSAQTSEMHNTAQITEMHGSSHVSENLNSMPLAEMHSSAQTSEMHNTVQITEMHGSSHASENLNSAPLDEMCSSAQTSEMHNTAQITEMHGSSHVSENLNSMPLAEMHSSAQASMKHNVTQITEMHGSSHASENLNSAPLDEMCSSAQTSEMHNTVQITEMHGSSHASENLNSAPLDEMCSSAQTSEMHNTAQITEMHGSSHVSENLNSMPLAEMHSSAQASMKHNVTQITEMGNSAGVLNLVVMDKNIVPAERSVFISDETSLHNLNDKMFQRHTSIVKTSTLNEETSMMDSDPDCGHSNTPEKVHPSASEVIANQWEGTFVKAIYGSEAENAGGLLGVASEMVLKVETEPEAGCGGKSMVSMDSGQSASGVAAHEHSGEYLSAKSCHLTSPCEHVPILGTEASRKVIYQKQDSIEFDTGDGIPASELYITFENQLDENILGEFSVDSEKNSKLLDHSAIKTVLCVETSRLDHDGRNQVTDFCDDAAVTPRDETSPRSQDLLRSSLFEQGKMASKGLDANRLQNLDTKDASPIRSMSDVDGNLQKNSSSFSEERESIFDEWSEPHSDSSRQGVLWLDQYQLLGNHEQISCKGAHLEGTPEQEQIASEMLIIKADELLALHNVESSCQEAGHEQVLSNDQTNVLKTPEDTSHLGSFPSAITFRQSGDRESAESAEDHDKTIYKLQYSTQNYLELVGRLQDHADVIEDIKNDFESQGLLSNSMEGLQNQLEETTSLDTQLSALADTLATDLGAAGSMLKASDGNVPEQIRRDLAAALQDVQLRFSDIREMCATRSEAIVQNIEAGKLHLESSFQDLIRYLQKISVSIDQTSETVSRLGIMNMDDLDKIKEQIQQIKDMEENQSVTRQQLEDIAFEVQYFISENTQYLSPSQSRNLLQSLSATQRAFKDLMEKVSTQRHTLDLHLEIRVDESQLKSAVEKQKDYMQKLQEVCNSLTHVENKLIGQQQLAGRGDAVDVQQYQQAHQSLLEDVQGNADTLTEVIGSTKKFLEENRNHLNPEQIAAIEGKLEEARRKSELLRNRAEDSRKDLQKVMTTAIKQETAKVAAVEQLQESKTKIEGLLDWISNIGKDKEKNEIGTQNGNPLLEMETNTLSSEDDANGNISMVDGGEENSHEMDLDKQLDRVKAHHHEILSQQQDLIIATQSAQAVLDRQGQVLSPGERAKLQGDVQELRSRYDTSLARAELQMKQVQAAQEEMRQFRDDCAEFETWLEEAEVAARELGEPTGRLDVLCEKLTQQKSFSEDVISHKGDLRFITISGQKVLDTAKACGQVHPGGMEVDTSGACAAVKERLDTVAGRYKALHSECNQLGSNLKDVVEKFGQYQGASSGLLAWLGSSEEAARKLQSEPIGADPQTLQRQLEETKALQGQTSGRQAAMETLRKVTDALITAEGGLLTNQDEIQETVEDMAERYDNLSKSVNDRHEKLQVTLTRSLSVQDGLDEMVTWMENVEKNLGQSDPPALNSTAMRDLLSKEAAMEQDMSSRQSSISAMKSKVKKFIETAEPSAAVALQAKMDTLSRRFTDACEKHKKRVNKLEGIRDKVELFEKTSEKVQQFVAKRSLDLSETEGPETNVNELSQMMEETHTELLEHTRDIEMLKQLSTELMDMGSETSKAQIQGKLETLSNSFEAFKETVKEKEAEVSSWQDQLGEFKSAAGALWKWIEESRGKVPLTQISCSEESLTKDLQTVTALLDEWASKAAAVQDVNSKGSTLCSLISALTSPAKTKTSHKSGCAVMNGSGSHAYLTNKELMAVGQDLSRVNDGYQSLGELLKARANELNGVLLQVREAREDVGSVLKCLEEMKNTAASWDPVSADRNSMRTQMEQQKAFEESMKVNKEKVQKLRGKLLKLIEDHPDSAEVAKWKQTLNQIDETWKHLAGAMEDRQQQLEASSRHLGLFQAAEEQLGQWLAEKELMMGVLGPLSVDPNMLNTQKQQVQILLNEFNSRRPQYEQLSEAADAILSTPGEQNPSCGSVKDRLATLTQKWQALTGQLAQRSERIDQASSKSAQFQGLLRSLNDSLGALGSQLQEQQALSSQPDAVKKQLEAANAILAQLRDERRRLKEAEALCSELSALVSEEYLQEELSRQLEAVSKPLEQLEEKAGKKIQQLNSTFASSKQFHQMSKDFQVWLDEKTKEQRRPCLVSAKVDVLRQSLREQDAFQKGLCEQETPYETIVKEGEALLQSTEGAEKVALQGQLSSLKSTWDDVRKTSADCMEKLQTGQQRAEKFKEHVEKLSTWIEECKASVDQVKLGMEPAEVHISSTRVREIQKDLDKHRGVVEMMNSAANSLLEVVNADREVIEDEKTSINKRVDGVSETLQQKKESLNKISQKLKVFNETKKEARSQLDGARTQMETQSSLGVQAYSNKNLTNMKAQQKALAGVQTQVDCLKNLAQELVIDVPDAEGVTDLLLQADSLEKDFSSISREMEERCSSLEGKLQGIGHFQNSIREMFAQFADLDDELDSMAPVARDLDTLHSQRDDIKSFITKLRELTVNALNASKSCKTMLEDEASPDLLGLKRDLEALNKQCGKLMDRARARETQLEGTLSRMREVHGQLQEFMEKLTEAERQEGCQEPVGMETEIINNQLEAFKVFQKEEIEPLQAKLQDLNQLGQGLIQSAAKGTSTQGLERDLEDVNTRWNTLHKKVADRSAKLHEALLHCGRFQDALESLLSWLTDTEELVGSQKAPSAEFKVVKAQIQEQKLLQRLLDDRKPTVELIKKEGAKVSELAEPADKEKILREIESLGQRWDSLLKKAESRHKQLEGILVVAQQFHETLEPMLEWLSTMEKRLANSEPIGTQTEKLQEQITQHKALEEEIMSQTKRLHQAISLGQVLRTMSCMDDKELVQAKLDVAQTSYIDLQDRCRHKAEMLQQALSNAHLFGEDEVALMTWLSEVHDRLSKVSVQDYKPEVLEKQAAEQLALHEDIELRKQNVDQAVSNGLELLKQTTGDEVIVIQGKLEGIKSRYAEIDTMSSSVSRTLEQALSLAIKLQHTHENLSVWLDGVEAELKGFGVQDLRGEQLTQAQERQKELLKEVREHRAEVDALNEVSGTLLQLVPWRAREGLDKMVNEDNERYGLASDTLSQHVARIDAAILRLQQFESAAHSELRWLIDAETKLSSLEVIRLEQEQATAQLQTQKSFSLDIVRHKDAVDEIVKTGDVIMSTKNEEERKPLRDIIQTLVEKSSTVSQLNSDRCLQLERALSLAGQFWETYEELWPWLQETRSSFSQLPVPAIEYEILRQQQEDLRQMRELIAEHKPHIDKMNKTGPQLLELSPVEGQRILETYSTADQLYSQLKADVGQRAAALDEAISKSTQFHDKIDPMLESLERIAERLRQPPSISVEVEKIREQIAENKAVSVDLEKLQPAYETLRQRGEEMIARSEGVDKDVSAKAVKDKLDQMVVLWNDIQALMEEREAKLLDVMDLAEKFWCDHSALIVTIKDTQDLLKEMEEPGVDPSVVKQQQESLECFKEEIDGLQDELDIVQNLGAELLAACGEPDKPVIKKSLDEVNLVWETLNKMWKERVDHLDEAMQAAVQFQDGLQGMFDWVDIMESKLDSMSPVGTDLETVKQQIEELKEFKSEAYQLQIEMERLNHQASLLLKKVTEEMDRSAIQEPMTELKMLWDNLDEKIINRQHKLEGALLALGQFQHALDELLTWMTHTEELLNEQRKTSGDPKAIEIALAKHHVLQNDVLAHKSTVEAVNKAGNDLIASSAGDEASSLQSKLENLSQRWNAILEKTEQRRRHLDTALLQAQGFHGEIEDMQQWLKDTERQLLASKAVGGLPETAREQLNAHLELCSALEAKEELYQQLMLKGQQLLTKTPEGQDSNTELDLRNLQEKWESVQAKMAERKVKLEEALSLAMEFHNNLQEFINWLTQAEQGLTMASPASLILETIMFQIDEHKVFVTEVNAHREQIIELDKTGTHLKYFSQKQDVVLIKNLLLSVQARWEKVVQRSVERGRLLDDARKRAKQFHESWHKLTEWLEESEKALDSELEIANDPDKIKMQLAQHKEFQKALGSKHSVYDTTTRTGRALKDKTSLQDDKQKLDDMLSELRDKWDTVCGKSVERQNKLEEALLFSGQFTDALQALIDWLYKVEPQLAEDQPVHGDIDLVLNLIDSHKVFQKELGKRTGSVQALKRSARELVEGSHDDSSWVKVQMQELSTRWETVCTLSVSKQTRLEQALCQAEEFHSTFLMLTSL